MTLAIREASGLTDIAQVFVRETSGLTEIAEIWVREASGLVQVFSAFGGGGSTGLSVSPTEVGGSTSSFASQRINTGTLLVTVTPPGPVDSIVWTFDDAGWVSIAGSSLSTAFRSPLVAPSDSAATVAHCAVTRGASTATIDVPASVDNFG